MDINNVVTDRSLLDAPFSDDWWKAVETRCDDNHTFSERAFILSKISADSGLDITEECPESKVRREACLRSERQYRRERSWKIHRRRKGSNKPGRVCDRYLTDERYVLETWTVTGDGKLGCDRHSLKGLEVTVKDTRDLLRRPDGRIMVWHGPSNAWVMTQVRLRGSLPAVETGDLADRSLGGRISE